MTAPEAKNRPNRDAAVPGESPFTAVRYAG
jgi:hypothetical protein